MTKKHERCPICNERPKQHKTRSCWGEIGTGRRVPNYYYYECVSPSTKFITHRLIAKYGETPEEALDYWNTMVQDCQRKEQ
jgi:hypothetical protein